MRLPVARVVANGVLTREQLREGWLIVALVAMTPTAFAFRLHTLGILAVLGCYFIIAVGFTAIRARVWSTRRTNLLATVEGLWVDGVLTRPKQRIKRGVLLSARIGRSGFRVQVLSSRPSLEIEMADRNEASALLSALDLGPTRTITSFAFWSSTRREVLVRSLTIIALVVTEIAAMEAVIRDVVRVIPTIEDSRLAMDVLMVSPVMCLFGLAMWLGPRRVRVDVGVDGLALRYGLGRRRFIPFSQITVAEAAANGEVSIRLGIYVIRLVSPLISVGPSDADESSALVTMIQHSLKPAADKPTMFLERDVVSDPFKGLDTVRSYRQSCVPAELLWDAVDDVFAPAAVRVAAAVALRSSFTDDDRERLRVSARLCVEDKLRMRLLAVAERRR